MTLAKPDDAAVLRLFGDRNRTDVERAISEMRAGRPVVLRDGDMAALVLSAELVDRDQIEAMTALGADKARLVLAPARLRRLGVDAEEAGTIPLGADAYRMLETLIADPDAAPINPAQVLPATAMEERALVLTQVSYVLPAALVVPLVDLPAGAVSVSSHPLDVFRDQMVNDMRIVSRAPVPLLLAPNTEFVVFRGGEGLRDQVAIIVGNVTGEEPPLVRLHSACLTGDLFGSLKCDCGDQLRGAVRRMAEAGGGVLLYLDQEGRGNGLSNKIRAYALQHEGFDTYEADETLGFGLDQRNFDVAAAMLKALELTKIRLLTNNPRKIAALRAAGITVAHDLRVTGHQNVHNARYLATKRDRTGHMLNLDENLASLPAAE